jgi:hypothetical protein
MMSDNQKLVEENDDLKLKLKLVRFPVRRSALPGAHQRGSFEPPMRSTADVLGADRNA